MFPKINLLSGISDWSSELNSSLFDFNHLDINKSAIDSFIEKNKELNVLVNDPGSNQSVINDMILSGEINETDGRRILAKLANTQINSKLMNLLLLGYISSVEAYVRKLLRDLINIDVFVRQECELKTISFGATYYQSKEMLPESLMEGVSFAKSENIIRKCNELLGLSIQPSRGSRLDIAMNEYNSICQLRHCIIHRFGKIGVNNVMELGLHDESFKECIEKPLKLEFSKIQKISKVTTNLVRELNQQIWEKIMVRLQNSDADIWTWDFRTDKKIFRKYAAIFFETKTFTLDHKLKSIYDQYRSFNL